MLEGAGIHVRPGITVLSMDEKADSLSIHFYSLHLKIEVLIKVYYTVGRFDLRHEMLNAVFVKIHEVMGYEVAG